MSKFLYAVALMTAAMTAAEANLLRLDFTGQIVASFPDDGTTLDRDISGFFILDPTVPDVRPEPDNANYQFPVLDGGMLLDGISYNLIDGTFNDVFILNDAGTFNDLFALIVDLQGTNGQFLTAALQFGDMTRTTFSDDSFPTEFDLDQFDDFEIGNTASTGIFLAGFVDSFQGGYTSAQLRVLPMPIPGTASLCVVVLLAWRLTRLRR